MPHTSLVQLPVFTGLFFAITVCGIFTAAKATDGADRMKHLGTLDFKMRL